MAKFPSLEWLSALMDKLNSDQKYRQTARNWEGDMKFIIEPAGTLKDRIIFYLDLWHGTCRGVKLVDDETSVDSAFTLSGSYENYCKLLKGELDPMQALLTRKLGVKGNMAVLMRNVPTVLDFVRCCRDVTDSYL